jgi:hypothetical protein
MGQHGSLLVEHVNVHFALDEHPARVAKFGKSDPFASGLVK